MKNKFLKAICTAVILSTAAIASAEPVIIEITAQDLAPYYGGHYYYNNAQYSAAAAFQPEVSYSPVMPEEQRVSPAIAVDPIENYLETDKPLLRPMRGFLPSYGLTEEDFERMGHQI